MVGAETMSVLVTVKAYPQLSRNYGEVVCVAGVRVDTDRPTWIRLYPVGFRDLEYEERFKKYQVLTLNTRPSTSDPRPESRKPVLNSIQLGEQLPSTSGWRRRWERLAPLAGVSTMCGLYGAQKRPHAPSLGLIKPVEVMDLLIEVNKAFDIDKQRLAEIAAAEDLFGHTKSVLEPSPINVRYRYRCAADDCRGHTQSIIDWEVAALARRLRDEGASLEQMISAVRQKFLDEMCGGAKDTYFFVGNQHQHPSSFLVLGVFWPPAGTDPRPSTAETLF